MIIKWDTKSGLNMAADSTVEKWGLSVTPIKGGLFSYLGYAIRETSNPKVGAIIGRYEDDGVFERLTEDDVQPISSSLIFDPTGLDIPTRLCPSRSSDDWRKPYKPKDGSIPWDGFYITLAKSYVFMIDSKGVKLFFGKYQCSKLQPLSEMDHASLRHSGEIRDLFWFANQIRLLSSVSVPTLDSSIRSWLESSNLSTLISVFEKEKIFSTADIRQITESQWQKLEVPVVVRNRIRRFARVPLADQLRSAGLDYLIPVCEKNDISLDDFRDITDEQWEELGIWTIGSLNRIYQLQRTL